METRWIRGVAVLAVISLFGAGAATAQMAGQKAGHTMMTSADLKWADAPPVLPPGAKMVWIEGAAADAAPFTFRVKLPANYKVAPHWHPAIEHVTVLSGTFNIGMGEKFDAGALKAMPAGSFILIPPKTAHFVQVKGETVIQVHGVGPWGLNYVNPEDDPRKKK